MEKNPGCPILREVGQGLISLNLSANGELRVVRAIQDVINLWKEGAQGKIALVEDAGTTTLGPILSKLAGVVCTSGALGSHLAIVTREFEIPALMGTKLDGVGIADLDRKQGAIEPRSHGRGVLLLR
jgi:phosphohistidine swiveling domain-containing protein